MPAYKQAFCFMVYSYTTTVTTLLKSLPSNRENKLETIQGQPPSLSQKIDGCKFHPRCNYCMEICTKEIPELKNITPVHKSACFLNSNTNV